MNKFLIWVLELVLFVVGLYLVIRYTNVWAAAGVYALVVSERLAVERNR